ncbi:Hypothetical_protein [Hexamita inflata]|uniref:Hypothetical_protein n=1 Tax=Hexamita inflata TaxID=28002 RepID=A0AA86P7Q6_9EUKA|nr:Hypothetical protein HINF_LOCUS20138 [Hexamita inflata]
MIIVQKKTFGLLIYSSHESILSVLSYQIGQITLIWSKMKLVINIQEALWESFLNVVNRRIIIVQLSLDGQFIDLFRMSLMKVFNLYSYCNNPIQTYYHKIFTHLLSGQLSYYEIRSILDRFYRIFLHLYSFSCGCKKAVRITTLLSTDDKVTVK